MKKRSPFFFVVVFLCLFLACFWGCKKDVFVELSDDYEQTRSAEEEAPPLLEDQEAPLEELRGEREAEVSPIQEVVLPDQDLLTESAALPVPQNETQEGQAVTSAAEESPYHPPTSDLEPYLAACATAAVRVRKGAGTGYGVLFTLGIGDSLPYLWREGDWIAVWTGERVGFLSAAYAYVTKTNQAIERTIRAGLAKLGTPYEWGAARLLNERGELSPYFTGKSFDCSSFVQYCYYIGFGIKLGNYTGSQADHTVGKKIFDYADLRRGDFYFTGSGSISHVVIHLGNGYLLQTYSANGGPVSVTTDARWRTKFISGRRPDPTVIEQFR